MVTPKHILKGMITAKHILKDLSTGKHLLRNLATAKTLGNSKAPSFEPKLKLKRKKLAFIFSPD